MQAKFWNLGAIALCAAALAIPASARDLTVVSCGGDYQDAQRDAYFKPFMQTTGVKMAEESWDGGVGTLRAKIQGGSNNWDVVQVESEELLLGCAAGEEAAALEDAALPVSCGRCGGGRRADGTARGEAAATPVDSTPSITEGPAAGGAKAAWGVDEAAFISKSSGLGILSHRTASLM